MNNKELTYLLNKIPILQVARLVVPQLELNGNKSTGRCAMHEDRKLGNLRFREDRNYAHCFTCGRTWGPINLVADFTNKTFFEAIDFLSENFPQYLPVDYEKEKNKTFDRKTIDHKRLSGAEYTWIGVSLYIGKHSIWELEEKQPKEHDEIVLKKIEKKEKQLNEVCEFLKEKGINIENDERVYREKLKRIKEKIVNKTP